VDIELIEPLESWEYTSLESILLELEIGSRPKGGVQNIRDGVPSLGGEHLAIFGDFNFNKIKYVPEEFAEKQNRGWIQPNDILIVKDGATTGKTSFVGETFPYKKALINEHVFRCKVANGISPEYVFMFLVSEAGTKEILKDFRGAAQGGISRNFAKLVTLPLAPTNEQKRISLKIESLRSHSSKARKCLDAILPLLENFRQSVLSSAFRGDLTADWRAQNPDIEPAEKLLERIRKERRKRWEENELTKMKVKGQTPRDDNWKKKYKKPELVDTTGLPELPDGWCWVPLSHLIIEGPTNGYSPKGGPDAQGTSSLKLSATTSGKLILNEDTIKPLYETIDPKSKHWLQVGDILIQRANSIEYLGATAYFDGPSSKYIYPDLMMRIRTFGEVLRKWLWKYCNSMYCREYFRSKATGTAGNMPKINGKVLKETPVPIGPYHEIEQSIKILDNLEKKRGSIADFVNKSLSEISFLDQSILSKAFRGELVPQDPNDEPVSQLLERINQEKVTLKAGKKKTVKVTRKVCG